MFYAYLFGLELPHLSAVMLGLDVPAAMTRLAPTIASLRVAEELDACPEDYSRSTKKKLGLLLALLHQPRLPVLDEPTNDLEVEAT